MKIKILLAASILLAACGDDGSSATNSVNAPESSSEVELSSSSIVNDDEFSSSSTIVPESSFSDAESSSSIIESSSSTSLSSSNSDEEANMVIDERDGKKYKTVTIGTQTWFAENLAYNLKDKNNRIAYNCPNEEMSNCSIYGNLYDQWGLLDLFDGPVYYPAVPANARPFKGLCPNGWHIPSIEEWQELLNNAYVQDLVAKSAGGTGESGFDVLLLGGVGWNGAIYFEEAGLFASVDERDDQNMVCAKFTPSSVTTSTLNHSFFVAIRCLKD